MFVVFVIGLFCLAFTGCQRDNLHLIAGKVTLDGTALDEGTISFMPTGDSGISTGAPIKGGAYSARVSPGKMIVKIYAERPLTDEEITAFKANPMNRTSLTPAEEMKKQAIPENYNDKSTLVVEIQGNKKDLDFQLVSQSN